jgi:ATP-dependent DNA helicase RecG
MAFLPGPFSSPQSGIEIFIFPDCMEIKSPGALLSTLTIEDLKNLQGVHDSRNGLIAKILRESNYMRELGEGMKRIFELMQQSKLEEPRLFSNKSWFSVTLLHK